MATASPIILMEDPHLLVVVKPAGMLTQGRPREGMSLEGWIRSYLNPSSPDTPYLGVIHRLDRPVSGVMVWAKTLKAARRLHQQFADRVIEKEYWAIVSGLPEPSEGIWDDWLFEENTGLGPNVQVCAPETPRARHAITRYRRGEPLELPPGCSWIRLWPTTGRTHQLRVQAGSRGIAVLGDSTYGSNQPFPEGIALHARALRFQHPTLHSTVGFQGALPPIWNESGIRLPEEWDSSTGL